MIDRSIGHGADREQLDAFRDGEVPVDHGISVETELRIGLLPTSQQQLLDQEHYGITTPPITVTIEGDN